VGKGDMATQPPVDIHASKGGEILVITILFTVLAIIVVLLRAYTRFILLSPSIEETFILLALVSFSTNPRVVPC
jgi:hypothetical protein